MGVFRLYFYLVNLFPYESGLDNATQYVRRLDYILSSDILRVVRSP